MNNPVKRPSAPPAGPARRAAPRSPGCVHGLPAWLALVAFWFALPAGAATAQDDPLAGLGAEIDEMVDAWSIPGVAVAVVHGDEVVFADGFGVREVGGSEPVDENTIFAVGSSSKAFTTAALAMLVDEGTLEWNDLVIDHLPTYRLTDSYITRDLRVRDLMMHNSGLTRGDRIWYGSGRTRQEVLQQVSHQPVALPLRSTFRYNNTTWIAAGEVIKAVSGQSWDDFVASRIFRPLGMARSNTTVTELDRLDNVATPHLSTPDGVSYAVPYRNIDNAGPAGSINSSALQMAQWVRLHLGRGEFEGERIFSEEQAVDMHSPHMVIPKEGAWALIWPESHFITYGMGWFVTSYRDVAMVSHGGNIDGMTAYVGFVPQGDYGMVILANLNGANAFSSALAHRIIDRMEGGEGLPWRDMMLEAQDVLTAEAQRVREEILASRIADAPHTLPLGDYAGSYQNDMYGEIVVTESEGTLRAAFGADFEGALEHWHYDTFRSNWDDIAAEGEFFRFELGTDGKVAALHAEIEGSVAFRRQDE